MHTAFNVCGSLWGTQVVASSVADSPGCLAGADAGRQARLEAPNNIFRGWAPRRMQARTTCGPRRGPP
ncbi:hypothetical protein JOD27_004948 [Lentzea nigeriaca]|nr:hypothetical protein [Lentzea nigeriaca]